MVNAGRSGVVIKRVATDTEAVDAGGQGKVEERGKEARFSEGGFDENKVNTLMSLTLAEMGVLAEE